MKMRTCRRTMMTTMENMRQRPRRQPSWTRRSTNWKARRASLLGAQLMPSQVFPKPLLLGAHWPACCLPACPPRHPYLNPTASLACGRMLIIIVAITIMHTGLPAACPTSHCPYLYHSILTIVVLEVGDLGVEPAPWEDCSLPGRTVNPPRTVNRCCVIIVHTGPSAATPLCCLASLVLTPPSPGLSVSGLELNPGDAPARNLNVDAPRSSTRPAAPVHGLESAEAPVGASGSGDDEEREAAASASAGLAAAPCLGASAAPGTAAASATDPDRAVLSAAASASRQAAAPSHGASAAGTAAASARAVSTPPPLATLEQAKAVKPFDVIDVLFSATQWHTAVVQRVDQVWHHRCCPRCAALAALAAPPLPLLLPSLAAASPPPPPPRRRRLADSTAAASAAAATASAAAAPFRQALL